MPTLARKKQYTFRVPGVGRVTVHRGGTIPADWYEHVPGRDRKFFDKEAPASDEVEDEPPDADALEDE